MAAAFSKRTRRNVDASSTAACPAAGAPDRAEDATTTAQRRRGAAAQRRHRVENGRGIRVIAASRLGVAHVTRHRPPAANQATQEGVVTVAAHCRAEARSSLHDHPLGMVSEWMSGVRCNHLFYGRCSGRSPAADVVPQRCDVEVGGGGREIVRRAPTGNRLAAAAGVGGHRGKQGMPRGRNTRGVGNWVQRSSHGRSGGAVPGPQRLRGVSGAARRGGGSAAGVVGAGSVRAIPRGARRSGAGVGGSGGGGGAGRG
eukprot:ctg_1305.g428